MAGRWSRRALGAAGCWWYAEPGVGYHLRKVFAKLGISSRGNPGTVGYQADYQPAGHDYQHWMTRTYAQPA